MDNATATRSLLDRAQIVDVVTRHATSIDGKRWDDFGECFADRVEISLPLMNGWVSMSRAELVVMVDRIYAQLVATQHISANHQISVADDEATCLSTLNATHYLGDGADDKLQREIGYYQYHLVRTDGWQIDRLHMTISWVEGNTERFRKIQANAAMPTADV